MNSQLREMLVWLRKRNPAGYDEMLRAKGKARLATIERLLKEGRLDGFKAVGRLKHRPPGI